jgi:hypothetical protein
MLRASYRLRDDRLVPDCLDAIDKAIRALIDFRNTPMPGRSREWLRSCRSRLRHQ